MSCRIPYGKQSIDEDDIKEVVNVLKSAYLTTGPAVDRFERNFAEYIGVDYAVSLSSGTAALHAAMDALGISSGDEIIVPAMTFAATANAVLYQGGTPVFADVEKETLLISPESVKKLIGPKTKAIIGVDYAGHPCDWESLRALGDAQGIPLVADGCHALGATYQNEKIGTLADMTCFSFHPVKHIATGEGGMVTSTNAEYATRIRRFRNHGITTEARQRTDSGEWFYEMETLGYNYRLTDIQAALGSSQLKKLPQFLERRQQIAALYDQAFSDSPIRPLTNRKDSKNAYHLYVVRAPQRNEMFSILRNAGIGVNVHYVPVYLHPYYQQLGYKAGLCPIAEEAFDNILSLPIFPDMKKGEIESVIETITKALDSLS